MLALLNLALADATICCWDAKYTYAFWRPITAIQLADMDGNPETVPEPAFTSGPPVSTAARSVSKWLSLFWPTRCNRFAVGETPGKFYGRERSSRAGRKILRWISYWLAGDPGVGREHLRLLEIEAGLRGDRRDFDLGEAIMARLHRQLAAEIESNLMTAIQVAPAPEPHAFGQVIKVRFTRTRRHRRELLAMAAGIVLLLSLGLWLLSARMAEPVLAEVRGGELSLNGALRPFRLAKVSTFDQPTSCARAVTAWPSSASESKTHASV